MAPTWPPPLAALTFVSASSLARRRTKWSAATAPSDESTLKKKMSGPSSLLRDRIALTQGATKRLFCREKLLQSDARLPFFVHLPDFSLKRVWMSAIPERKNAVAETNILVGDADRSDARASHACLAVGDDSDEGGREDTPLSLSRGDRWPDNYQHIARHHGPQEEECA